MLVLDIKIIATNKMNIFFTLSGEFLEECPIACICNSICVSENGEHEERNRKGGITPVKVAKVIVCMHTVLYTD